MATPDDVPQWWCRWCGDDLPDGQSHSLATAKTCSAKCLIALRRDASRPPRPAPAPVRIPDGPVARVAVFVAEEMRVNPRDVLGEDRARRPALARHVAVWIARRRWSQLFSGSTTVVGRVFGRDHSTIVIATQRIDRLRDADPKFRAITDDLLARAP